MKTIKVHYRTGGTERKFVGFDENRVPFYMPKSFKSKTETIQAESVEDLLSKFPPKIASENLRMSLQAAFEGRKDSVTYNFGKGNAIFFFEK